MATGYLGGGFKHVLFLPLPGEMIQFDEHIFQLGLVQPPPKYMFYHFTSVKQEIGSETHLSLGKIAPLGASWVR